MSVHWKVVIWLLESYWIGFTCEKEHFGSCLENELERKADKTESGRIVSILEKKNGNEAMYRRMDQKEVL